MLKPLILLTNNYFLIMLWDKMFMCIMGILSLKRQLIINILEDITMSKFFLKKSWVNLDMCIEDYYNSGTTIEEVRENLNWSPYSNIVGQQVKLSRHTIEEIDEETYKNKIKKSNSPDSTKKTVSLKDCKE
jgi:hypothetical protein|tara:strand:+ start:102 stop:494 length:393 start_codon:yes stop_codon:yes gene_type:complete